MPYYLVKGNAQQLFSAFRRLDFLNRSNARKIVDKDIPGTLFFGSEIEANLHIQAWQEEQASHYYTQGDMSAATLQFLLGDKPFIKECESDEEYRKHYVCHHFAYINKDKKPCALMAAFRKDNPSQWIMGLIRNTPALPSDREVILLSSIYILDAKFFSEGISVTSVTRSNNEFIQQLGSPFLQTLVRTVLNTRQDEIKVNYERINLLLRTLVVSHEEVAVIDPVGCALHLPALFAEEDSILDFIVQKKIQLSFAMLQDYLSMDSGLRKELKSIVLTDNVRINKNLVQMTIIFYEEGTLEDHRELLQNREFIRLFGGLMSDPIQIKLIPFLLKKQYTHDLMQFILKEDVYYQSVSTLLKMGLAQDVPTLFANPDKLSELKYIHGLADEACKRLCLVFWVKDTLTKDGYEEIVAAAKQYPLMPNTLVYLDKKGVVNKGIKGLKEMALNPQSHLQKSIAHQFFSGDMEQASRKSLRDLSQSKLEAVSKALHTLRKLKRTDRDEYRLVLDPAQKGEELRIFLPQIAAIKSSSNRRVLTDILYKGVRQGIAAQGKAVLEIEDSELRVLAKDLCDRFFCVMHLQKLKFNDELINWAAQVDNKKSKSFRHVIFQVDAQCMAISERLSSNVSYREMLLQWRKEEEKYKKNLYTIAYDAFTNTKNLEEAKQRIHDVEESILDLVDPPIKSQLYKAFIIITNIVITLLTIGVANYIKEQKTGNYWFFNQSKSGENLRALSKMIIGSIEPEKSHDGPNL